MFSHVAVYVAASVLTLIMARWDAKISFYDTEPGLWYGVLTVMCMHSLKSRSTFGLLSNWRIAVIVRFVLVTLAFLLLERRKSPIGARAPDESDSIPTLGQSHATGAVRSARVGIESSA